MPRLITCFHTNRVGKLIGRIGVGTNLLCEDVKTGERFVVLKRKPAPRPTGRKREAKPKPEPKRRPYLRRGQRVLLNLRDEGLPPVPAKYLGKGIFVGVDDPVWAGCKLSEDAGAEVLEVVKS